MGVALAIWSSRIHFFSQEPATFSVQRHPVRI
jgi:hypothetical protein